MSNKVLHDNPRVQPDDDLLERAPLAQGITEMILRENSSDSLTIGIIGAWGTGKSTVLNFIKHYANDPKSLSDWAIGAPIILDFNPWWFSDREDLFNKFLEEILRQLRTREEQINQLMGKPVAKTRIASAKENTQHFIGSINNLLKRSKLAELSEHVGLDSIPKALEGIEQLLLGKQLSMTETRELVVELLNEIHCPVWVFIEDFDRLESDALRQMIALLRSFADLPYTRYFIAFDPNEVARQLEYGQTLKTAHSLSGERYIDKLVQFPVYLNEPSEETLSEIFANRIEAIIPPNTNMQVVRYTRKDLKFFYLQSQPFLPTIRQMNRYVNALRVAMNSFEEDVHFWDVLRLELLKISEPSVWTQLARMKPELLGNNIPSFELEAIYSTNRTDPELVESTKEKLQNLSIHSNLVVPILEELFPHLTTKQDDQKPHTFSYAKNRDPDVSHVNFRVSDPYVFRNYFGLKIGLIRSEILAEFTSLAESSISLQDKLILKWTQANSNEEKGMFFDFLDSLGLRLYQQRDQVKFQNYLQVIIDCGDDWIITPEKTLREERRQWICRQIIRPFRELNSLIKLPIEVFQNAEAPVVTFCALDAIYHEEKRYRQEDNRLERITELRKETSSKIYQVYLENNLGFEPVDYEWNMVLVHASQNGTENEIIDRFAKSLFETRVNNLNSDFPKLFTRVGFEYFIQKARTHSVEPSDDYLKRWNRYFDELEQASKDTSIALATPTQPIE